LELTWRAQGKKRRNS